MKPLNLGLLQQQLIFSGTGAGKIKKVLELLEESEYVAGLTPFLYQDPAVNSGFLATRLAAGGIPEGTIAKVVLFVETGQIPGGTELAAGTPQYGLGEQEVEALLQQRDLAVQNAQNEASRMTQAVIAKDKEIASLQEAVKDVPGLRDLVSGLQAEIAKLKNAQQPAGTVAGQTLVNKPGDEPPQITPPAGVGSVPPPPPGGQTPPPPPPAS